MKVIKSLFVAALFVILQSAALGANITGIQNVQIIPPNPMPGDTVELRFQFRLSDVWNSPNFMAVLSDTTTLRPANTAGQWVVIGNGCATPANPSTAQVSPGCAIGNNLGPAATWLDSASYGTYTFIIPPDVTPGFTYSIIVGARDYDVYLAPSVLVDAQNYVSFTIPLPPPSISLMKTAEGSSSLPGGLVLYTIYVDTANTNDIVITDVVPPDISVVKIFDGGILSGGVITWSLGNVSAPVRKQVSFLARISAAAPLGTTINNTANGSSNETGPVASNNSGVTVGPSLILSKSASPNVVEAGDTVTFFISYTNEGFALTDYHDFSSDLDISSWSLEVGGATWGVNTVAGVLEAVGPTGQWSKFVQNTSRPHNGMFVTDMYVPSSNPSGDAVMMFNFIDPNNNYHARIQTDTNQLCFDRVVAGTWTVLQCVTPVGFSIQNDSWYTVKVQVVGTTIKMKVWPKGTPEPAGWIVTRTDTSHASGGKVGYQANEGADYYDNLKIFEPVPATNSGIWDTVPACMTYLNGSAGGTYNAGTSVVSWNTGTIYNETGQVWFRAIAGAACSGSVITNRAFMDSAEPPVPVTAVATVIVGTGETPTPTFTRTVTGTATMTITASLTRTATPSATPSLTPTPTPSATASMTYTLSFTPANTVSFTATATATFTGTATLTATTTATGTFSMTATYTATATRTATPSNTATGTETLTITQSATPSYTSTLLPTGSPTNTPTSTHTCTATPSLTFTPTHSFTPSSTDTQTQTVTFTETASATVTVSSSVTPSLTVTQSASRTTTPSFTFTDTPTQTASTTATVTVTDTLSPTFSSTASCTATNTGTSTASPTRTGTSTPTVTQTSTLSATATPTSTVTLTCTHSPTITVTPLPMPYVMIIECYNSAGEKVRTLADTLISSIPENITFTAKNGVIFSPDYETGSVIITGAVSAEGSSSFVWDGANEAGQIVSGGNYYIKVKVMDEYGHEKAVVIPLQVVRSGAGVRLDIYNSAGELVRSYVKNEVPAGNRYLAVEDVVYSGEDSEGTVISYGPGFFIWDTKNFSGVYAGQGSYEIKLTITEESGRTDMMTRSIVVLREKEGVLISSPEIWPNPVSVSPGGARITWTTAYTGRIRVSIYNLSGMLVRNFSAKLEDMSLLWNLETTGRSRAAPGVYVVVFEAKGSDGRLQREKVKVVVLQNVPNHGY